MWSEKTTLVASSKTNDMLDLKRLVMYKHIARGKQMLSFPLNLKKARVETMLPTKDHNPFFALTGVIRVKVS